jgi:predicted short-subunit dehydrogenase-like oxidoreductase (DUF2520 family)
MATALFAGGCTVEQIYSRRLAHAQTLAQAVHAGATDDWQQIRPADLYVIAVTDAAIPEAAARLNAGGDALVVHTSGSTGIEALARFARAGILYPLQTFGRQRPVDWTTVPLFVVARSDETLRELQQWASLLSDTVVAPPEGQLLRLHTAGVWAGNFVNCLLGEAKELAGDSFPWLYPLVRETVEKAFAAEHPRDVQTGPALRRDTGTMDKQRALLPRERQTLYDQISTLIQNNAKETTDR